MESNLQNYFKKPFSKRKFIFVISSCIFVAVCAIGTILIIHQIQLRDAVKVALKQVPSIMETDDNSKINSKLDELASNSKITIVGDKGFDGATYCVTGTNNSDKSIVYYISSKNPTPQKGSCQTAANLPKPITPSGLSVSVSGSTQVGFTWEKSIYAANYTLQCSADKVFRDKVLSYKVSGISGDCKGLESGISYYARVRGNNQSGSSSWSDVFTVFTDSWSTPPAGLKVVGQSSTKISYSWSKVNNADSYQIEWASDINFTQDVGSVVQAGAVGVASGLKPATLYYFHVKAVTPQFDIEHAAFSNGVSVSTPSA